MTTQMGIIHEAGDNTDSVREDISSSHFWEYCRTEICIMSIHFLLLLPLISRFWDNHLSFVLVHPWLSVHGSYRCLGQDDPCEGTTTPTPITTTSGLARLCPDGWEDGGLGHCYIFLDHRDNFENAKNMWVSGLMIVQQSLLWCTLVNVVLFLMIVTKDTSMILQVFWEECNSCWRLWRHFWKPTGIKYLIIDRNGWNGLQWIMKDGMDHGWIRWKCTKDLMTLAGMKRNDWWWMNWMKMGNRG